MGDKTTKWLTVTAVNAKGADGTRCRAGFTFGPEPKTVEVDAKQAKAIAGDPVLNSKPATKAEIKAAGGEGEG